MPIWSDTWSGAYSLFTFSLVHEGSKYLIVLEANRIVWLGRLFMLLAMISSEVGRFWLIMNVGSGLLFYCIFIFYQNQKKRKENSINFLTVYIGEMHFNCLLLFFICWKILTNWCEKIVEVHRMPFHFLCYSRNPMHYIPSSIISFFYQMLPPIRKKGL